MGVVYMLLDVECTPVSQLVIGSYFILDQDNYAIDNAQTDQCACV